MLKRHLWPDLRLRTKGLFVVAAPAAATVLLTCTVYMLTWGIETEQGSVRHSIEVNETIEQQSSTEAEMGALVEAYFITGDKTLVDKTRTAIAAFEATARRLSALTASNPAQARRCAEIAVIQQTVLERIFGTIARSESKALPWEDLKACIREIESERVRVKRALAAIQSDEKNRLQAHFRRVERMRSVRRGVTIFFVFLALSSGTVCWLLFASGISKRIGGLQENVSRLTTGAELHPFAGGRDEIGLLGEGIAKAAGILRSRSAVLENALHGIAQADASGSYLSYNRAYAELAGFPESGVPSNVADPVHPDDRPRVEAAIVAMRAKGRAEVDARILHPQRGVTEVSMTILPVPSDVGAGYYVFLSDNTLRKQAEAALIEAKDAAVASNLAKTRFLANISHDIRTPLNAILGAADLLSETPLSSDQSEYVKMFQRNCRRLVSLINDFLDFSRIEAGAVQVQKTASRIRDLVDDAVATFREPAASKGLELLSEIDSRIPEWMMIDPLRTQQVLTNLISNAIKFTAEGEIGIHVQKTGRSGTGKIRFEVRDTGSGIRPEDHAKVFAAFSQLPDQDSSNRGSGLGLAICRQLVELMGGEIGLSSQPGSGSTFYFTLPFHPGRAPETAPASSQGAACRGWCLDEPARILIAEDTADNRLLLEHYLRGETMEITFAASGEEALELSRRREFDLIFMDIDMPGLDGCTATRLIREWQSEQGSVPVPIVALSAHAMQDAVQASLDAGCIAHIAKPVDRSTLLRTIRRYAFSKSVRPPCAADTCAVEEGIASLVPVYLGSKPKQIEAARAALAQRDFETVRRFGHNLKGTGGGYGFPRIAEIGSDIERAASAQDEGVISRQLEALLLFVTQNSRAGTSIETAEAAGPTKAPSPHC